MKFTIDKAPLVKALQRVQGIVEKRNSMPVLSNVLIEAASDKLTISATDLEIYLKDKTNAKIDESGALTVNCRKLFEIVKELPSETIDFSLLDGAKLSIKCGRSKFKIPGLAREEFPTFPSFNEEGLNKIDAGALGAMVDRTLFATSTDETRYNINGILLESSQDGKTIRMVATDGHRLALIEHDAIGIKGEEKGVILPRKGVTEIRKLLEEKEEDVYLGFNDKNVTVKKGETIMNIRLIDGEFPDYKQVIPEGLDKEFIVDTDLFLASLKRVSILSADKIKGVKFSLATNRLTLTSSSPENGDATEELDIEYKGDGMEIAFNAKYFIEALETLDEEMVKVELKENLSPGVVKFCDSDKFSYVVMPMRL